MLGSKFSFDPKIVEQILSIIVIGISDSSKMVCFLGDIFLVN